MLGNVSAGLPAPLAALLRASLAFPGRPTSQSVTPIAVLHSIIIIIIHHAASAASRERRDPLHRTFGVEFYKSKRAKRRKPTKAFGFSSRLIAIDGIFSFCTEREGGRSLKRGELFLASQPQIPRPALPYNGCLVPCCLIVPTSSSLGRGCLARDTSNKTRSERY